MICCSNLFNLHPASQSIADEYLPKGQRSLFLNIGIGTPGCQRIFNHSALIRTAQKSVLIFGQNFLQNIRNWLIVEKCNQNGEKKNPSGFNVLLLLTDLLHTRRDSNSVRSMVAWSPWSGLQTPFRANKLESLPLRGQPTGLTLLSFATAAMYPNPLYITSGQPSHEGKAILMAHPTGFEPTACRLGDPKGGIPRSSAEVCQCPGSLDF